ncbi:acyclic terpene utilization AtuA family protein [Sporosarcina contaminans]|uniref:Acyclic terpene utilization AtuA family protein n=1 Tax=Sporosarcina contaminans TaxID=633403 RepID=A0ABW3TWT2_9BACL
MLRIGSGAGFSGDRLDPAIELAEKGDLHYLILECLAERTIALAQKRKKTNELLGYDPLLEKRMRSLLPIIKRKGVRIVTNMGAANPISGAQKIIDIAEEMGLSVKVAAVTGDNVLPYIYANRKNLDFTPQLNENASVISANAYMGADSIVPALQTDADIIITGRVADPSLFLAPMVYHFGWSFDDMKLLGRGTVIGHLLECGGQLTGGYFADPGKKDVPNMANIGFPFAEIQSNGSAILTKLPNTGGALNLRTVKEQLLYEVMDPSQYVTPDVTADFTTVSICEAGIDRIKVTGGAGRIKPNLLKVSVGYEAGFLGEGEITYAGENALGRAELAGEIIEERLKGRFNEIKVDLIGVTSAHRGSFGHLGQPYEVRLRVAAKANSMADAMIVGEEVEALYTNGPAGGGGARKYVQEVIGIVSTMVPRDSVDVNVVIKETANDEN